MTGLLDELRRRRRISQEEAIDLAFREGLKKARKCVAEWRDLCRREGLLSELNVVKRHVQEKRAELFAADVRNSQAIFESYQTSKEVGNLLILYNVYRADLKALVLLGKKRGLEVEGDQHITEIPRLRELMDRYLFRPKPELRDLQ
jgi:hypothetical protein